MGIRAFDIFDWAIVGLLILYLALVFYGFYLRFRAWLIKWHVYWRS